MDGYNLFYGCLKGTPFKWLDVAALLRQILHQQDPDSVLSLTKYFTSHVLGKFSVHGQESERAQQAYLRALQATKEIDVVLGRYSARKDRALRFCKPPNLAKRVSIWRLEEKETDVSIAISMYRDVVLGEVDQILLVSNDSDMCPALQFIRQDFPKIRIGLVVPSRPDKGEDSNRVVTEHLVQHADWTRSVIQDRELASCQFPDRVRTGGKPADKPSLWRTLALPAPP